MAHIVAIINQKGGVGKTTTTAALGAGLSLKGRRVLYIDLDPQGNLSDTMNASTTGTTALEVLTRKAKAREAIQNTPEGAIIAAGAGLAEEGIIRGTGREYRLKEAIEPIKERFDYILIDCPPSLGVLSVAALTAADSCIVPAQADKYSLTALEQFRGTLEAVQQYTNSGLRLVGILITRYSSRAILSREAVEMMEDAAASMGTMVFNTRIREAVAVKESQMMKQNIFSYAPKSNAAADYMNFVQEVLNYGKENI